MEFVAPMLAVTGDQTDELGGYAFEFKWDGVRAVVGVEDDAITIWSRRGNVVTNSYPELVGLREVAAPGTVIDGEIVAFDAESRPSFSRLQRRMHVRDPRKAAQLAATVPVAFLAFDLPVSGGVERFDATYESRRDELESLGLHGPHWQVPPTRAEELDVVQAVVDDLGLEGLVAKRLGSPYRPGVRSADWRKLRSMRIEEFVVGGYRTGEGARTRSFGSLLLGYHDEQGRLRFAGSVGSGFTERELERFWVALDGAQVDDSPFADPVPHEDAVFVRPEIVVAVQYREFTPDGLLRQPSYKGQRNDVSPEEVVRAAPERPPPGDGR